jgi:RNA polymerase sigma-70 factor (ECF subfamily)
LQRQQHHEGCESAHEANDTGNPHLRHQLEYGRTGRAIAEIKKHRVLSYASKTCLYDCMKTSTTSGVIAENMGNPVLELEDFERLVQQYRTRVLRFLFASVRDMDLAETLTQDCFWNAYKSRRAFRGDCSINTWLMRIAVNLVRNHSQSRGFKFWKKAQGVEEIHDWRDRSISPEERAGVNEQVQAIWEATTTLSERQRTVFLLRYVEDLDIPEIAQSTGLTENAVNVHLFRAVRGIRKRLGKSK